MPATITATEAKNRFGEVVRRVYKGGETLIVERAGLPVAVILPISRPDVRVMLDANVLLTGVVFPRWPWEMLRHAVRGDFKLVLGPYPLRTFRRISGWCAT